MLEVVLSLSMAVLTGFALGLEREITNKHAGLRTHILVCLGSCVFTLLSIHGFPSFAIGDNVLADQSTGLRDTARVAAQIVTGIGFIGAGTVMRHGSSVHGLTTAATLWMAASIGMACGAEKYDIAIVATLFSILVLIGVKFFERKILIHRKLFRKTLKLDIVCENQADKKICDYISDKFMFIKKLETIKTPEEDCSKICVVVNIKDNNPVHSLRKQFEQFEGIQSITISEADEQ
jgi:putative Mg2+ transporter-C (MgtC) family protein